ncbi:hypothetical protein ATY81_12160 [Rhizobium sp. R72]|uniref:hypothetical protein n=1 Tax=unclassified Rhizobium TaxID=2613769 RepID=UPI000B53209A|nr:MULTISPECIES: hypothetical protein [unclassified Rhizobium]OWV94203.1 hypothetical protein ATY81_12160 [Rhizobium sp. R72]OWV94473.1 hypothetical protein ATY80_12160 [Rhizobium sp. R711]OWV99024.1 hypothetical protein ATY79_17645 [Rhizobium sp. R693]
MVKFGYLVASLLILIGVVWMGQGSGYFPYPQESFMINQTPWVYWGALATIVGIVVIVVTRNAQHR